MLADGVFEIVFHFDDIKSGGIEGDRLVMEGCRFQKGLIHFLPHGSVLEVVLCAQNRIVQLNVRIVFIMVIHNMDLFVELVYLR